MNPIEKETELLMDTYHQVDRRFGYNEYIITKLGVTLDRLTSVFYEAVFESMTNHEDTSE